MGLTLGFGFYRPLGVRQCSFGRTEQNGTLLMRIDYWECTIAPFLTGHPTPTPFYHAALRPGLGRRRRRR